MSVHFIYLQDHIYTYIASNPSAHSIKIYVHIFINVYPCYKNSDPGKNKLFFL